MLDAPVKHSVTVAGHRTSVSLEQEFWTELEEMARAKEVSLNELVTSIDRDRRGGLSSAIRVHVLTYLHEKTR